MSSKSISRRLLLIAAVIICFISIFGISSGNKSYAAGKSGFYQESGKWVYYENGNASTKTWVVKGTIDGVTGWYYIENGKFRAVDIVAKNENGWWFCDDGKVDFNYNGIGENINGKWYCRGGKVDFNYKGFANYANAWWYCSGGKVQTNVTYVINGTVKGEYGWWNVVNGKVLFKDTIAKNQYGWWRIKNGKVDFNCNTVEKNDYGWWCLRGGKVDFDYNGLAKNQYGWWYCRGGKVNFDYNGFVEGTVDGVKGTYYVSGSKVQQIEGVVKYGDNWVYVKNGRYIPDYNGFAENRYGWWYIENGKVNFKLNSCIKGTVKGETAWWAVKGGKVTFDPVIVSNSNGDWYCKNGKVDFNYNGSFNNNDIKGGKVVVTAHQNSMRQKAQGYESDTRYLIMVDYNESKLMILEGSYNNWQVVKYIDCNAGWPNTENETPRGIYSTATKFLYFGPDDEYRCWYATQFRGDLLFHSILYKGGEDAPNTIIDDTLGRNTSHGCIRMLLENAKWIYDNVPYGTKVVIY